MGYSDKELLSRGEKFLPNEIPDDKKEFYEELLEEYVNSTAFSMDIYIVLSDFPQDIQEDPDIVGYALRLVNDYELIQNDDELFADDEIACKRDILWELPEKLISESFLKPLVLDNTIKLTDLVYTTTIPREITDSLIIDACSNNEYKFDKDDFYEALCRLSEPEELIAKLSNSSVHKEMLEIIEHEFGYVRGDPQKDNEPPKDNEPQNFVEKLLNETIRSEVCLSDGEKEFYEKIEVEIYLYLPSEIPDDKKEFYEKLTNAYIKDTRPILTEDGEVGFLTYMSSTYGNLPEDIKKDSDIALYALKLASTEYTAGLDDYYDADVIDILNELPQELVCNASFLETLINEDIAALTDIYDIVSVPQDILKRVTLNTSHSYSNNFDEDQFNMMLSDFKNLEEFIDKLIDSGAHKRILEAIDYDWLGIEAKYDEEEYDEDEKIDPTDVYALLAKEEAKKIPMQGFDLPDKVPTDIKNDKDIAKGAIGEDDDHDTI